MPFHTMEAQKKVGLNIWKMKIKNIHNSYKSFENIEFDFITVFTNVFT